MVKAQAGKDNEMKQKNRMKKENRNNRSCKMESQKKPKESPKTERMAPSFEGDGEEVFMEMMHDLASLADMAGSMEQMLMAVVSGRLCPALAMKTAAGMRNESSAVMEKWTAYAGQGA